MLGGLRGIFARISRQRFDHRIDHRRMKSMRGPQPPPAGATGSQFRLESVDCRMRPGDNADGIGVDSGDRQIAGQAGLKFGLRQHDREHRSFRQLLHHGAARGNNSQGVFEPHHAGERRGDEFADAVAKHGGWLKAQAPP